MACNVPRRGWVTDYPLLVFALSFTAFWAAVRAGVWRARAAPPPDGDERDAFRVVLGATLTLVGLIIGFSFSMAVGRYDQRKTHEAVEANAIGTEFLRVELLPAGTAADAQHLLRLYVAQRIAFYKTRDDGRLARIDADTAALQRQLWASVQAVAAARPTPVTALTASGMNEVLDAQGYTQAVWWNRIPDGAWLLMAMVALIACALTGYGAREARLLVILPAVLAVAFFFVSDIDSPRHGLIRVVPRNLVSLAESMRAGQ